MDNDLGILYSDEDHERQDSTVKTEGSHDNGQTPERDIGKGHATEDKKETLLEDVEPGEVQADEEEAQEAFDQEEQPATDAKIASPETTTEAERDDRLLRGKRGGSVQPEPSRKKRKSEGVGLAELAEWTSVDPDDSAQVGVREDGRYGQDWAPIVGEVEDPPPPPVFDSDGPRGGDSFRGGRGRGAGGVFRGRDDRGFQGREEGYRRFGRGREDPSYRGREDGFLGRKDYGGDRGFYDDRRRGDPPSDGRGGPRRDGVDWKRDNRRDRLSDVPSRAFGNEDRSDVGEGRRMDDSVRGRYEGRGYADGDLRNEIRARKYGDQSLAGGRGGDDVDSHVDEKRRRVEDPALAGPRSGRLDSDRSPLDASGDRSRRVRESVSPNNARSRPRDDWDDRGRRNDDFRGSRVSRESDDRRGGGYQGARSLSPETRPAFTRNGDADADTRRMNRGVDDSDGRRRDIDGFDRRRDDEDGGRRRGADVYDRRRDDVEFDRRLGPDGLDRRRDNFDRRRESDTADRRRDFDTSDRRRDFNTSGRRREFDLSDRRRDFDSSDRRRDLDTSDQPRDLDATDRRREFHGTYRRRGFDATDRRRDSENFDRRRVGDDFDRRRDPDDYDRRRDRDDFQRRRGPDNFERRRDPDEFERRRDPDDFERRRDADDLERRRDADDSGRRRDFDGAGRRPTDEGNRRRDRDDPDHRLDSDDVDLRRDHGGKGNALDEGDRSDHYEPGYRRRNEDVGRSLNREPGRDAVRMKSRGMNPEKSDASGYSGKRFFILKALRHELNNSLDTNFWILPERLGATLEPKLNQAFDDSEVVLIISLKGSNAFQAYGFMDAACKDAPRGFGFRIIWKAVGDLPFKDGNYGLVRNPFYDDKPLWQSPYGTEMPEDTAKTICARLDELDSESRGRKPAPRDDARDSRMSSRINDGRH